MSTIEISQSTPSTSLDSSRASLPPSPDQLLEAKPSKASGLLLKRKSTIYDFSVNTAATSLNDLDFDLSNEKRSVPNSATSNNDCSRWNFESRVLSRNQTMESDALGPRVYSRNQSLEADIAGPEDEKVNNVCLGVDLRLREREVCPEILEHSDEEAHDLSDELSRRVLEEDEKLKTPKTISRCQDQRLEFDGEGPLGTAYHFSNGNKTVIHKSNIKFSTLFANRALPSTGKSRFSIRIEHANKMLSKLYVGVASGENKDKSIAYKPGYYFVSAFSRESYLNRLQIVKQEVLPKQGQIITVCIDMDCEKIWFEVEGQKILEGKLSLSKTKANEFYPCIALGEAGGSVSFVERPDSAY